MQILWQDYERDRDNISPELTGQLPCVILSVAKNHYVGHCAGASDSSLRSE
jgi:hypothetical protein